MLLRAVIVVALCVLPTVYGSPVQCDRGYERREGRCQDINECLRAYSCHPNSTCSNTPGDFECKCKKGYLGDGKELCIERIRADKFDIRCERDGITLTLLNYTGPFSGRIFVRGQTDSPHCSKEIIESSFINSKSVGFKIPYAHCNAKLINATTLETTVVMQRLLPLFPSKDVIEAYDLRCAYTPAEAQRIRASSSKISIDIEQQTGPTCKLSVSNSDNERVSNVIVGQSLTLQLDVQPNATYSILPRNCFAVNDETGERIELTDKWGCSADESRFPQWTRVSPSIATVVFDAFKQPDSYQIIRFQCDCIGCVGACPEIDCSPRAVAKRRFPLKPKDQI